MSTASADQRERRRLALEMLDRRRADGTAGRTQAARVLGRSASADRHRPRVRAAARGRDPRRARLGARRVGAGAGAEPAAEPPERARLTYVFISHDLAVAEYFCDRVAVLYLGQVMELADRTTLFRHAAAPLHGVAALRRARSRVPVDARGAPAAAADRRSRLGGRPPARLPVRAALPGRPRPRCLQQERPPITTHGEDHLVACHFPGEAGLPFGR